MPGAATRTAACRGTEIAAVETITKGPMLDGKPYHVGFPYGAEGDRRAAAGGRGWSGRTTSPGPGRPSLAYGFGVDFLRYFVKQDPAWSYTGVRSVDLHGGDQAAAGDAVADGSGSVGVPRPRRQAAAVPRLVGPGAVAR